MESLLQKATLSWKVWWKVLIKGVAIPLKDDINLGGCWYLICLLKRSPSDKVISSLILRKRVAVNLQVLDLKFFIKPLGSSIKYVHKMFQKINISNLMRTRVYQGVRIVSFSENFAYLLNGWCLFQIHMNDQRMNDDLQKY